MGWASIHSLILWKAAREEESLFKNHFEFCKDYVDMHKKYLTKEVSNLGGIKTSLAECYRLMKDFDSCDALYKEWLAQEPDWGWGWIGWSDGYWLFNFGEVQNFDKAEKIIKKGLSIENVLDKKFMEDRLRDLQREKIKKSLRVVGGCKNAELLAREIT